MYNRYIGNTGKRIVIDDRPPKPPSPPPLSNTATPPPPDPPLKKSTPRMMSGAGGGGDLLRAILPAGLDSSDLLLALIFYFLYKESGDTDFLIMLGALVLF